MADLHAADPLFYTANESDVITLGNGVCNSLEQGYSSDTILLVVLSSGMSPNMAGEIVAYSVLDYCPEYADKVYDESQRYT